MCRLLGYMGKKVLVHDVLYRFGYSLVNQSIHAKESEHVVNGDGFGLGWYDLSIDQQPGLFRSIQPAWNDVNLRYLTKKLETSCFVAHIRAATAGVVSKANCHPFHLDNWLFAHNGNLDDFVKIKRALQNKLTDEMFLLLNSQTDSQHMFAYWTQLLKEQGEGPYSLGDYKTALIKLFTELETIKASHQLKSVYHINIVLTDGQQMLACRYTNVKKAPAPSLYYATGQLCRDMATQETGVKLAPQGETSAVLISSEKMDQSSPWQFVPENTFLNVFSDLSIELEPIPAIKPAPSS